MKTVTYSGSDWAADLMLLIPRYPCTAAVLLLVVVFIFCFSFIPTAEAAKVTGLVLLLLCNCLIAGTQAGNPLWPAFTRWHKRCARILSRCVDRLLHHPQHGASV